jgi:oxygen-independent coproporphyrinogen-3 oxidase
MIAQSENPGLYLHIPFCRSKCGYCDFYSVTSLKNSPPFIRALLCEMELASSGISNDETFSSIYIGGGTPSLLDPMDLQRILSELKKNFKLTQRCEITIEVNPGTVDEAGYYSYLEMGINRINLGVQSFLDHELKILERIHTAETAEQAYAGARRAGFENIGLDLIYGIPRQSIDDWKYNVKKCIGLQPEHISAYNLTIEPNTPFAAGNVETLDDDTQITLYTSTEKMLQDAGYLHYEVSNYARSEALVSQHNLKYWMHIPYIGFGPSAHSFWNGRRWSNHSSLHKYINALENNHLPISFQEQLAEEDIMLEHIFLSLRTCMGLNLRRFRELFNYNFLLKYREILKKLKQNRLIIVENEYIKFTTKGMLISDEILSYFAKC